MSKKSNYISTNRSKHYLKCHLIFVCKYRKKLLIGKLKDDMRSILLNITSNSDFEIEVFESDLSQPDVIMLAGNPQKIKLNQFNLTQCEYVLSSSAYLVRREYIPKLISNIKESIKLRKPLDVHWNALQEKDTWILYRIGYQYANYSDIECKTVNYGV
jgi:hypothetical protein